MLTYIPQILLMAPRQRIVMCSLFLLLCMVNGAAALDCVMHLLSNCSALYSLSEAVKPGCDTDRTISVEGTHAGTCEPLDVPFCNDLPYNQTIMPHVFGQKKTQEEAALEISMFWPLIGDQCSAALKPFLCSVYAPQCESGKARAPCKTTCEAARQGCEPFMKEQDFAWPEALNCDKFSLLTCEGEDDGVEGSINMSDLPSFLNSKAESREDALRCYHGSDEVDIITCPENNGCVTLGE
ncbi:frizzled-1-like [Engraulis encrasicolus]|uniref:frizzled-1-like n=1 Tax=Engraulis encrasicolus TaxID=184585 RepID=UPI002FD0688E